SREGTVGPGTGWFGGRAPWSIPRRSEDDLTASRSLGHAATLDAGNPKVLGSPAHGSGFSVTAGFQVQVFRRFTGLSYTDRSLTCADCGATFTFTAGEQEFHASKGFTSEPRRCPDCRRARRASG